MLWETEIACRFCLLSDINASFFEEVFENDVSETSPLSTKIFSALKSKVCRGDGLPRFVCKECVQKLNFIIFCNTWSSKFSKDFEEVQSLLKLYKKQDDDTVRSILLSMYEKKNSTKVDPIGDECKFNAISLLVSQIESILCQTEGTDLCFSENENEMTECISLALDFPCLDSPHDLEQYCTSPAVADVTQYPSNNKEIHVNTEGPSDFRSRIPEETSNAPVHDSFSAPDVTTKPCDNQLSCPECQALFSKKSLLWKHLMSHNGASDKYQCSSCRRKFLSTSELHRHIRAHNGLKPYKCGKCNRFFSQKNLLENHLNWHEGRKGHLCDICGERLSSGPNLKAHISNLHSSEKKRPFKCTECGKCFARSHHLENHMIIHKKCRPYLCTTCGVTFKRSSQLHEHENIHSGERQFKCSECNKCFRTKRVLNVHKLVHSEQKPHQCSQCSKSFVRRGGLLAHLKAHKH